MIEAGYMVRPRMHVIRFDQDLDKEELIKSAGRVVEEAFNQHEYISKRTGKIFVTVTGVPMMKSIMESKEIKNLQKRNRCLGPIAERKVPIGCGKAVRPVKEE